MARTGICGTDLHIRSWDASAQSMVTPPVVLGHEIAGHVEAIGPGVDSINVGDLVSVEGHIVCGRCRNCRAGRRQLCPNTKGVGVHRDGGFAELVVVPAGNVWRHRADLDIDVAAIFDPFGNAVHSALSFPVLGEDVLVTGAGPIGIMAALVVRHAGARHVVVTDVSEYRLELARKTGVTEAVNPIEQGPPRRDEGPRHERGVRRRPGDVGRARSAELHARHHGQRWTDRAARPSR